MRGEWPPPGDDEDRYLPDPDEAAELNELEFSSAPSGFRISGMWKIVAVLMALAVLISIMFSSLGPLAGGRGSDPTSDAQDYAQWIAGRVNDALAEIGATQTASFLGVQFEEAVQFPIVGIQTEGIDPRNPVTTAALQQASIIILRRMFDDDRARAVSLVWLRSAPPNGGVQTTENAFLIVGMTRETAALVDWLGLAPEDLRHAADVYQEPEPPVDL